MHASGPGVRFRMGDLVSSVPNVPRRVLCCLTIWSSAASEASPLQRRVRRVCRYHYPALWVFVEGCCLSVSRGR